jgi:hypothetical protein
MNAAEILDIARRLDRLSPSRTDPHAFFEERSELAGTLKRWAADLRASPSRPSRPVLLPPQRAGSPLDSVPATPVHGRPTPLFAGDAAAASFLRWLVLVGAVEVSLAAARRATGLSKFGTACLLARLCDAGVLARVRLPPTGAGRGRPRIRWRVDSARLAALTAWPERIP